MALATNIVRRPGSCRYYLRIGVPKDLQPALGKREIWESLGTADPAEARSRAASKAADRHREFVERRRLRSLTAADLQEVVWKRYCELVTTDERFRRELPTDSDLDEVWAELVREFGERDLGAYRVFEFIRDRFREEQAQRAKRVETVRAELARGETRSAVEPARQAIEVNRFDVASGSPQFRELAQGMQRAELEALRRAAERDAGNWGGEPRDPLVRPPAAGSRPLVAAKGETIMELYDRFQREKRGAVTADTWNGNRAIVKLFAEFVGEAAHISAVNRKNVRDWKDKLHQWPVKAADTKAFEGMSFRKVIEANATAKRPAISGKTINKYLSALGSFAQWLLANGYIDAEVMSGMYLTLDKRERKRFPFSTPQLVKIFSSPLFVGCAGEGEEHKPGTVQVRDWRFWIPLIGLFTGARLGEIAQLLTDDVRCLNGQWVFHITREGSTTKSVKTMGSERVVPVHSELIKIGLLDYHGRMVRAGHDQLFPEIKPDARGFYSGMPSQFFNDYLRAIRVKADERVNFHSFRHGMADAFRRAGYLDEQFAMLLGHTKATTTGRYGIMPEGMLSERVRMIEAVAFPGLHIDCRPTFNG